MHISFNKQFKRLPNPIAAGMAFGLTLCVSVNAQAALSLIDNGLAVYDNVTNISWTQNANLLGSLESSQGYDTTVKAVIAAEPVIHDTPNMYFLNNGPGYDNGTYVLSANDFGSGGQVDWWAAQAYVSYLNSIDYGGSKQWRLPATPANTPEFTLSLSSSELGQLFYAELGGVDYTYYAIRTTSGPFSNIQGEYWSGTEYPDGSGWAYIMDSGFQLSDPKSNPFYAWAVSPGNIAAVPAPAALGLFGSALPIFISFNRRHHFFLKKT
jgi:hypothetical protein